MGRGTIARVLSATCPGSRFALAEHPHSVANHREQTFDTRDQLDVLNLRSVNELRGDGGEILAHQLERALEIFPLRPARASFAPRFLNFREVDYLGHFLCCAGRISSRDYRLSMARVETLIPSPCPRRGLGRGFTQAYHYCLSAGISFAGYANVEPLPAR